jgi:ribosomal protein L28
VIPEYPHGASALFKQSNKGLYGGQMVQFGNNVSEKTETKTRRMWKPNILNKALYSVALKKRIKLRITSKVLKVMDREGGLDNYLLKESDTRIKELGPLGWALRWTLMQTPEVIARFRAEAAALGLAQDIIDKQWPTTPVSRELARERQKQADVSRVSRSRTLSEEKRLEAKRNRDYHSRIQAVVRVYRGPRARKLRKELDPSDSFASMHVNKLIQKEMKKPGKAAALAYKQAQFQASQLTKGARDIRHITGARSPESYALAKAYIRALGSGRINEAGGKEVGGKEAGGKAAWLAQQKARLSFQKGQKNNLVAGAHQAV